MSYSRRQLYAMGETLGDCVTRKEGGRILYGGGGGSPAPTQSTTNTSNIPEYARPYVETMLAGTQKQLFNTQQTTDPTTGETKTDITTVKPYQAFGAPVYAKDAQGNFLQNPDGSYQMLPGTQAGMGPGEMAAARSAYAGFDPLQQRAYGEAAGLQAGPSIQAGLGGTAAGTAQALGAGQQYTNMATNPYAVQQYMSPYMQNVVDVQQREAQRMSDILGTQQRGQATQAGAYGGTRQALMEAERQRNLATQQGAIQAQGLQSAYDQAVRAQQFGSQLGLQGAQAGIGGAGQMFQQGLGVLGQQQAAGAARQAYEQNVLNQAIQNYAIQQQYPQQQLAFMNAQLRGLPMQAGTTQMYQAPPNYLSQAAGLGVTGLALNKLNAFGKKGGLPKDFEKKRMDDGIAGLGLYNAMKS